MKINCYLVLFSVAAASSEQPACHKVSGAGLSWLSTKANSCSTSKPLCIDAHKEVKKRCCSADLRWDPEPTCETVQHTFGPCPEGAVSAHDFCIFIITNITYPFHCPYEEVLPFAKYVGLIESQLFPIWMPVERNEDEYGDGLHLYTEPSELYRLSPENYVFKKPFRDKRCMVYHNSKKYEAVPCSTPHTGICAYYALNRTTNRYCSRIFQTCITSDYPAGSKCFCPKQNSAGQQEELAEFLMPHQNSLVQSLQRNCLIGLEKVADDYQWINSKTKISYTFWADDAIFGDSRKYGVMTEKGWILVPDKNEANCSIHQKEIFQENCDLVLTYNSTKKLFFLDISNPKAVLVSSEGTPLVFCFTDASSSELVRRLDVQSSNIFFPIQDGPGHYWCEAFVYPNVKLIKSNVVFLSDTEEEYIAIMETKYGWYPLDTKQLKSLQAKLHGEVTAISSISKFLPRVYKLVSIDEKNSKATLNFHFSIKSDKPLKSYANLRRELSKLSDFRLIDFLSADICIDISEYGVTWLNTNIGEVAEKPKEGWCTRSDGSIMNRRCEGDFINGAEWSTLEEPCILQESTNITVNLTHIVNQQKPMRYIHQVLELITEQTDITEFEINLISQFLQQLADLDNADFNLTVHIINELMNLPESTFSRAQELYNSTDKILATLDKLIEGSGFIGEMNLSNLKILSDSIRDVSAIDFYEESYTKHYGLRTPNPDLDNFHCSLMFHDIKNRLSNCSFCDSQLIIVFFKKSTLFHNSPGFNTKHIIRLMMPAFRNDNKVKIKAAFQSEDDGAFSCSNWQYSIGHNKGSWSHKTMPTEKSSYLLCEFDFLKHHAFIQVNLTDVLDDIVARNEIIEKKLSDITSFMMSFGSKFVTSEVVAIVEFLSTHLESISGEASLDAVANLVNEFMDISPQLLQESEKKYRTSTTVLRCLQTLSQRYDSVLEIHKSNFYLYIGSSDSTEVKGFGVKLDGSRYIIELLDTVPNMNENYELYGKITRKPYTVPQGNFAFMIHFKNSLFTLSKEFSTKAVGILSSDGDELLEVSYLLDPSITTNQICEQPERSVLFHQQSLAENGNKYYKCLLSDISHVWLVYDYIDITSTFDDIINNSTANETSLRRILEILTKMFGFLSAIDIFLISQIFSRLYYVNKVILEICVSILDILTHVNEDILEESQSSFQATERILADFNRISSLLNESMEVQKANTYFSVIVLGKTGVSDVVERSFHHPSYADYVFTIDISPVLHHPENTKISKVIFTVYYTNAFFSPNMSTAFILNVILPDCEEILSEGIVLSVAPSLEQSRTHCGYWNETWVYGGEIMSSSCTFFRQGYISLIARDDSTINVTKYLSDLFDKSDKEKLYQLQGIVSKFAFNFTAKDLELVSLILQSITEQLGDLNSTVYITNSLMRIPKDVLRQAGEQGALRSILMNINKIVSRAKPQTIFEANFGVAKCSLCTATTISFTKDNVLSCSDNANLEDVIATLYIDRDLVERKMVCEAAITVFMNSDLFVEPNRINTSVILGISFNKKVDISDGIMLAFNKDIFDQDTCSYWISPKGAGRSGTWSSIAPAQIGSTKNCSFNTYSYYTLTTATLSSILDNILIYYNKAKDRLFHTKEALQNYKSEINYENICKVANILRNIENLTEDCDVAELADIMSLIAQSYKNQRTLNRSENYGAWDILYHADRLLGTFTEYYGIDILGQEFLKSVPIIAPASQEIEILSNILPHIENDAKQGNIHMGNQEVSFLVTENEADLVLSCKEKCSILQVQSTAVAKASVMKGECDAALSPRTTHVHLPKKLRIQLFHDAALFQGGEDLSEGVIVKIDGGTGQNGTAYSMYYKHHETSSKVQHICGYWKHVQDGPGEWAVDTLPASKSDMKICSIKQSYYFSLVKIIQNTTDELVNIENSTDTFTEKLRKVMKITEEKAQILHPVDILIISDILGHFIYAGQITVTEMNHTSNIVNNLLSVPRQVLKQSQHSFSATDKVLYNLDQISLKTNSYSLLPQTHFYSINIDLDNIYCGFTIQQKDSNNYEVDYIVRGTSIEDVAERSFVSGVLLSDEILKQLESINPQRMRMIANIFFKDYLFNDRSKRNADVSVVNGVLIPDLSGLLEGRVNIFYKSSKFNQSKSCEFWKYLETPGQQGSWKADTTPLVINSTVVCAYNHITHFAMLISNDDDNFDNPDTDFILSLITNVNCLLSTLGLIGIVVTAVLFERWRNNTGNQILLHFSLAISIKMAMLYASNGAYRLEGIKSVWCDIIGAILHYAILSESCWMLIIAILQFKRFVEVLGGPPKYILWKACICGWAFPALPVIILAATNKDSYTKGHLQLCYPSDLGLYLGVWLPLIIILTINCVIFVFIIYNVCHKKTEAREPINSEKLFQWRLALLLFFMLGLTWLFGFISLIDGAVFFTYLFCFSATLQGFVMFLFFIVFNKSTRLLYMQALKMWLYSKGFK